ncbi:MAG: leucine-rich repeat protein [Clostridia bacterium]|nr:leucine-rich repeat protein [Clostridia bacterium]
MHIDISLKSVTEKDVIDGKLVIPEGVTSIDKNVGYGLKNLEEVVIPNSVKTIEENAFSNCNNLKSITIPLTCNLTGRIWWTFRSPNIKYLNGYVIKIDGYQFCNAFNIIKEHQSELEKKSLFIEAALERIDESGFVALSHGETRIVLTNKETFINSLTGGNENVNEILKATYLDKLNSIEKPNVYEDDPEEYREFKAESLEEEMGK